jgi:hypothetical protein
MTQVTPASQHYTRCNQDVDEQQAILSDLASNPRDYLAHPDGMVRSHADWALEYLGICVRRAIKNRDRKHGLEILAKLHKRLRDLA